MRCATSGFSKNRDTAISLAARLTELRPRHSCRRTEHWNWMGCGREPAGGHTEMKVIRSAAAGMALGAFGPWAEVIDRAWQLGAEHPEHLVSDGNGAIAAGIGLVYGGEGHISRARFACCGSICGTLGGGGICGGAAAECRQFSGSGGAMRRIAGNGRGGVILVCESAGEGVASFDDGASVVSDDVAIGAAQPGVAAAGAVKDGMDGAQPAGAVARAGPDQLNRLETKRYPTLPVA